MTVESSKRDVTPPNTTLTRIPPFVPRFSVATVVAVITFALICVRAVMTADPYWDTLAYHWPFAARLGGICNADCFTMPTTSEYRYEGFPKLWHWLQGILWRLAGSPAQADVLAVAMVALVCGYLKSRFAVPLAWSWLGFLAIPETQIELTSTMIDLPLNAALTLAILVTVRMLVHGGTSNRADIALALAALFVAANSKFQLATVALLFWICIAALAAIQVASRSPRQRVLLFIALALAGSIVLTPKLLWNLYDFGNPFYPITLAIGPLHLPGQEPMLSSIAMSDAIVHWPGPLRWLASVLEFDAFRGRPQIWMLGQGDVLQSSPSFRMGGYFVAYVIAMVMVLIWSARNTKPGRLVLMTFAAITLLCACLPLSFESRYYSFWMLTLVSMVLALAHAPLFASTLQPTHRLAACGVVGIALVSVVSMTGAAYLKTERDSLANLIAPTNRLIAQIPDGATLCVLNRAREAILYSSVFHPNRHYRTKVLWGDEVDAACTVRLDTAKESVEHVR